MRCFLFEECGNVAGFMIDAGDSVLLVSCENCAANAELQGFKAFSLPLVKSKG